MKLLSLLTALVITQTLAIATAAPLKTFGVALFNDCSRHEAGQLYPAIIGSEFVAKG